MVGSAPALPNNALPRSWPIPVGLRNFFTSSNFTPRIFSTKSMTAFAWFMSFGRSTASHLTIFATRLLPPVRNAPPSSR